MSFNRYTKIFLLVVRRDFLIICGYETEFMIIQANFSSGFKLAQILVLDYYYFLFYLKYTGFKFWVPLTTWQDSCVFKCSCSSTCCFIGNNSSVLNSIILGSLMGFSSV